jgi:4-diphosphocytidyl-2-C-methyl-D-erythritol kinase
MADPFETGRAIVETAPAKLNLFLHVGARRDDGYHEVDSLVVFTAFGDTVRLTAADELHLRRTGPRARDLPAEADDDLAVRAVRALAAALDRSPGAAIELEKQIPVAAGIGGGSADAAAVIRALCRAWNVDPTTPEVLAVARRLGADVPVCLAGRAARVSGIGDRVDPVAHATSMDILLVNPNAAVSTAAVFASHVGDPDRPAAPAALDLGSPDALVGAIARLRNDLAVPAATLCPVIDDVLATLAHLPGCRLARMSGSGATCFALFDDAERCAAAAHSVSAAQPEWWVMPSRTTPAR